MKVVMQAIQRHGNANAPLPSGPPFFRFSDAAESLRTLEAAGFVSPQVTTVPQAAALARFRPTAPIVRTSSRQLYAP